MLYLQLCQLSYTRQWNVSLYLSTLYERLRPSRRLIRCRTHSRGKIPQSAQDSSLGTLEWFGANIHGRPIEQPAILFRRKYENLHPRMPAQQKPALCGALVSVVEGEDQDVRPGFLNGVCQLILVLQLANHLDVRLVSDNGKDKITHQSWTVCHQHSQAFHGHLSS